MLMVLFNFNLCCNVHMRANCHSISVLNEIRKLMDLPGATGENICIIKHSSEFAIFLLLLTLKSRQSIAKTSWFRSYKTFFKVSVKVVRVTIFLYVTPKRVKLYTIFLCSDSILDKVLGGFGPKPSMGELTALPHTPYLLELITKFLQIISEKIIRTLW